MVMKMDDTNTLSNRNIAAAEIDLMPYVSALLDARWWLLLATVAGGVLAGAWAFNTPYMYESGVRASVVNLKDPGGVSPDDRRASEVLTLVEHGFVMGTTRDNHDEVILARLRSRDFTTRFLDQFNIYKHLYPEHWSEEQQSWKPGFKPDRGESLTRFRDEVRAITLDEETEILTIAMRWHDPVLASEMANLYVDAFNEFIREKTQNEVQRKQIFLHEELLRSDIVEIQQSIYRLIEAQTAIAMLASARDEYALEIIDPAAIAYKSFTTSRKKKVIMGTFAGVLLGIFAVLLNVQIQIMLRIITRYRAAERSVKSHEDYKSNGSI